MTGPDPAGSSGGADACACVLADEPGDVWAPAGLEVWAGAGVIDVAAADGCDGGAVIAVGRPDVLLVQAVAARPTEPASASAIRRGRTPGP
jgi:hypothetical protein